MIEIYLFIHPFGFACYETEKKVIAYIQKQQQKIDLHILPLVNLVTNRSMLKNNGWTFQKEADKTAFLRQGYSAALDVKAAQLQGKKYARTFLLNLQEAVLCQHVTYTPALVEKIFTETGGDIEVFREDRQSSLVKNLFWKDQETARTCQVEKQNSAILYNYYHEEDGFLLDGKEAVQAIPTLCQIEHSCCLNYALPSLKEANSQTLPSLSSLKLL